MKFKAVTIKDIAKALGLSTSTVSRALSDSYEISAETKKIVLAYAEKIHYKPNPIALSLKERKTKSIGVIISEIANSFFSQIINGIEYIANEKGYTVIISQSHDRFSIEENSLQYLTSRSIDGLLVSVSSETVITDKLKAIHAQGMPIVFFDRIVEDINTHKVIVNNFDGAYQATKHLIDCGYRKIAILCNTLQLSIARERLAGYKAALTDHSIAIDPKWIRFCEHGGMIPKEIEDAMSDWLLKDRPDAIFASSDKLTIGSLRILKKHQLTIPGDLGLIGFSNGELTDLLDPPLSVVRQPAFEMGKKAMSRLLELVEAKQHDPQYATQILDTELIIRDSTRRIQ